MSAGATATASSNGSAEDAREHAERLVEDWSERVAHWVSRAAARTREEVEDIWAEAQAIRRGQ